MDSLIFKTTLRQDIRWVKDQAQSFILLWEVPLSGFLLALGIYFALAALHGWVFGHSSYNYFSYLADAFLHRQLYLREIPPLTNDLVLFQGKYYLYWPPFPALLSIPFVAILGINFSDIFLTVLIGAGNVALIAQLLRKATLRQLIQLDRNQRAWLVIFFALGTVHVTLSPLGRVWFTAQLIGFGCVALAYLAVLSLDGWKAFFLTGLALSCAMLTRNHLIFTGIWPAYYLLSRNWSGSLRRVTGYVLAGGLPVILALALLLSYNYLRFGGIGNVGLDYHLMGIPFLKDYEHYGAFSLHYLPVNLYYQYLAYPFPLRYESFMGGSLFLLSPVFLAIFWSWGAKSSKGSIYALIATILFVNIPVLLLMGTGWVQFGPRYTLDFTVPLLLLTAMGVRKWPGRILGLLALIAIVQYLGGAITLIRSI